MAEPSTFSNVASSTPELHGSLPDTNAPKHVLAAVCREVKAGNPLDTSAVHFEELELPKFPRWMLIQIGRLAHKGASAFIEQGQPDGGGYPKVVTLTQAALDTFADHQK